MKLQNKPPHQLKTCDEKQPAKAWPNWCGGEKQLELLLYKLLNDALLLWSLVFFGLVIAEGAVPGYFSAYLSFTKMILVLFAILALIAFLGKRNDIVFSDGQGSGKNKLVMFLLGVSFLLIINSLRSLNIAEIIVVSLSAFVILLLGYKIFILSEK